MRCRADSGRRSPRRALGLVCALTVVAGLTACQLTVAAPDTSSDRVSSAPPSYPGPVVTPGHDAAAVAAKNLDWQAGNTLSVGVPVGWNDQIGRSSGTAPAWTKLIDKRAGLTRYQNANGCLLDDWQTVDQQALMVTEDDRSSTLALFKYLVPELAAEALRDTDWPWTGDAGKPGPVIQFLSARKPAVAGVPANIFSARMLNHAGVGLVLSLACPAEALIDPTLAALRDELTVQPPAQ